MDEWQPMNILLCFYHNDVLLQSRKAEIELQQSREYIDEAEAEEKKAVVWLWYVWLNISELQIWWHLEDNSGIIFLISKKKISCDLMLYHGKQILIKGQIYALLEK